VLQFDGPYIIAPFVTETGNHVFKDQRDSSVCYVEVGSWAIDRYPSPREDLRLGAASNIPKQRVYDIHYGAVEDQYLNTRTGWNLERHVPVVLRLMNERLEKQLERLVTS
jgi:hypothetical protein